MRLSQSGMRIVRNLILPCTSETSFYAERDVLLGELNEVRSECDWLACQKEDLAPAEVLKLTIERNMLLEQRDQAYGEVDDLCRERNRSQGEIGSTEEGAGAGCFASRTKSSRHRADIELRVIE